jgi:uncharacterized phage protein (TIGR01671 family)
MNRKIKFRGEPINKAEYGEWFYGFYLQDLSEGEITHYIFNCPVMVKVIPKTVCQFTGLLDKNGNEIYEGDIVKRMGLYLDGISADVNSPLWDSEDIIELNRDVVVMDRFPIFWLKNESFGYEGENLQFVNEYEVIGNIHENPELINE